MDPLKALLIEQKAQYEETYFASSKEWIDASEVEHNKLIESAKSVYTQLMSSVALLSTDQGNLKETLRELRRRRRRLVQETANRILNKSNRQLSKSCNWTDNRIPQCF
ncbi:uncharacterized protein LOC110227828 isoform X1 [Arabidopsis lyrata subsp. lyrata]|uniref:uncharacterized protein LOC110227828 isoform X1 n=1 Tax=Arabidopsis lyrata subsp. lyrata TaxID=81972 RepID=UPI000A29CAEF|nr:uncharacterized protein LOC110227828 isoform X1 [Arabidopsis lyrata subsp. lyrata]|eukprot:XP_020879477.1 uncharacterized protein LOC110227828 isoform X1 [Arabidopsis lyrata subsp. lyrata]